MPPQRLANNGRRRPTIGLTPLIDVVFILLIFFMLASSFLDWRDIDLAPPTGAAADASMEGAFLVEIRAEDVRFAGEPVPLDALAGELSQTTREDDTRRVFLLPAQGVALQRAVSVLEALTSAGVKNISFVRAPSVEDQP